MAENDHICGKCGKTETTTFFAKRIPIPGSDEEYEVESEYICTDCMTAQIRNNILDKMQMFGDVNSWFPFHQRIHLAYEDELYGSFNVDVWRTQTFGELPDPYNSCLGVIITKEITLVVMAENVTYGEVEIYSMAFPDPKNSDIAAFIMDGMNVAIMHLCSRLSHIQRGKSAVKRTKESHT